MASHTKRSGVYSRTGQRVSLLWDSPVSQLWCQWYPWKDWVLTAPLVTSLSVTFPVSFAPSTHVQDCSTHGFPGTYLSRPCERNLVYANVRCYCCPSRWPISWQNIDDSWWKASLTKQNWRKAGLWELKKQVKSDMLQQAPTVRSGGRFWRRLPLPPWWGLPCRARWVVFALLV